MYDLAPDPAAFSALIKAELDRVPDPDSWARLAAHLRVPERRRRRRLSVVVGLAAAALFLAAGAAVAAETDLVHQFIRFTKSHQQPPYPATQWMIWAMATANPVPLARAQSNGQFPLLTSRTVSPASVDQMILPCETCPLAYRLIYPLGEGVTATVYETLAPRPSPGKSIAPVKDPSLVESRTVAGNQLLIYYTSSDHALIPAIIWTTPYSVTQVVILFDRPARAEEALAFAATFH